MDRNIPKAENGLQAVTEPHSEIYKRLTLRTATECRRFLNKVARMLINRQITTQEANALVTCVNCILQSIRVDELERKVKELEVYISSTGRR